MLIQLVAWDKLVKKIQVTCGTFHGIPLESIA